MGEGELNLEPHTLINCSFYKLIWKGNLFLTCWTWFMWEKDVYDRKSYCVEGLIKAHFEGLKAPTSQVRLDVRTIVPAVWIERWLRWLIITIINDPLTRQTGGGSLVSLFICLYDGSSIIAVVTVYGNTIQKVNIRVFPMVLGCKINMWN